MIDANDRLMRGDVVFFAPRSLDAEGVDLDDFPTLAAHVQSYPYVGDRPWFHVAVATGHRTGGDPEVIGFAPTTSGGDAARLPFQANLTRHRLSEVPGELRRSVLRPPDGTGALIGRVSEQQVAHGTRYSTESLLGFALMMLARMMPDEGWKIGGDTTTSRGDLTDVALGADLFAEALPGDTCVSVVAKAVSAVVEVEVCEPPSPPRTELDPGPGSLEEMLIEALNLRAGGPSKDYKEHRPAGPALVLLTKDYVRLIESSLEDYFDDVATRANLLDMLRSAGRHRRQEGVRLPATSGLVSPAMLYEALLSSGFAVVN